MKFMTQFTCSSIWMMMWCWWLGLILKICADFSRQMDSVNPVATMFLWMQSDYNRLTKQQQSFPKCSYLPASAQLGSTVDWRYDGMLCEADTLEFGAMWECPLLIELNTIPIHPGQQSKAAVKELADSFNNLRAFMDINNGDSAKSPQVVAANDPRDASQMVISLTCRVNAEFTIQK